MSVSPVTKCVCGHLRSTHDGACQTVRGRGRCGCQRFQRAADQPHLDTLTYLQTRIGSQGYAPSVREMAVALGVSSSATINSRLDVLETAGLITRVGPRAIRLETS